MANGTLQVSNIETSSGSGTITIGQSGETISIPSGCTITNSGTQTGFGGTNTPAFHVKMNGSQTFAHSTTTKIEFDEEVFDSDSKYDTSTYRFTPTVNGKYLITLSFYFDGGGQSNLRNCNVYIYKNGSVYGQVGYDSAANYGNNGLRNITSIMELDADDYVEAYVNFNVQDSSSSTGGGNTVNLAQFSGMKIIE